MKCISCGYELKEGSRFCTECGIFQKQKKICPGCKIELPTDARFCINCGTPQPKFCLYCNAELSADAKFCMCCGTKVRELPIDGGSYLSRYASLYNLTEKPMELSSNKEGSSSSNYILFGDWPQSVKSDEVIINSMSYVSINGWECYKGSDGCFYVKKTALPLSKGAKFTNGQSILRGVRFRSTIQAILNSSQRNSSTSGCSWIPTMISTVSSIFWTRVIPRSTASVRSSQPVSYPTRTLHSSVRKKQ